MKKRLLILLAGVVGTLVLAPRVAGAQEASQQTPPLPIDKDVRMGTLDNGLTYIIRHNEKPKDRAHFFISQRVGSVLEEENQRGLAHFLEHMAFQGSKNFPDKGMIDYLEKNGVKFGSNLNAYTAIDETVYEIMNAPTTNPGFVDSCLLILHDWSGFLALTDEEIDKERGVIQEEWRTRDNGSMRAMEQLMKEAFPEGHRYGNRMPIGLMDVVMNFPYDALRSYYQKWYRPDLQAIIVVGDVDVDRVESKIKEIFADIPAPENAAERVYFDVPNRDVPKGVVITDPEVTGTQIGITVSYDAMPMELRGTAVGFLNDFLSQIIGKLFNNRFAEILEKPNPPFINAGAGTGPYITALTEDAFEVNVMAEEGQYARALEAITAELKRVREYGFTEGELNRVVKEIVSDYDNAAKEKKNRTNAQYAAEYSAYFTKGGYIPGIEIESALAQQMAQVINVEMVNQQMKQLIPEVAGQNFMIFLMAVDKPELTYPTNEELLAAYNAGMQAEVEPYVETVSSESLMEELPTPGAVAKTVKDQPFGSTKWELTNGIEVYLLPTDYADNEVTIEGISPGGLVQLDQSDTRTIRALNDFATAGGYGTHTPNEIDKILTGRKVSLSTGVDRLGESVSGTAAKDDLEQLFQALYLSTTQVREDTALFAALRDRLASVLDAQQSNPMVEVSDSLNMLLYGGNELALPLKAEDVRALDYDKILESYRDRFANMGDFTFFIVGDFEIDSIKPYVEQYIATLPNTGRKESWEPTKAIGFAESSRTNHFTYEASTPSVMVADVFTKDRADYTLKEGLMAEIISSILNQQYFVSIREDAGGTYGVSAACATREFPKPQAVIQIVFQTNKEQADSLNERVKKEMDDMVKNGLNREFFDKAVLNLQKKFDENQEKNGYWLGNLKDKVIWDRDFHTPYLETLKSITPEEVRQFLAEILDQPIYLEMVATGEPATVPAAEVEPAA